MSLWLGQEVQAAAAGPRHDAQGPPGRERGREGHRRGTRPDMGLIFGDREAVVSGVFTTNLGKAAPVLICMEQAARGTLRGRAGQRRERQCLHRGRGPWRPRACS